MQPFLLSARNTPDIELRCSFLLNIRHTHAAVVSACKYYVLKHEPTYILELQTLHHQSLCCTVYSNPTIQHPYSHPLWRAPCPGTVQVGARPFTLAHHCTPRAGALWQPHPGARVGSITDEEGGADLVARLGTLEGCGVARVLPRAQHLVDLVGREPELCIVAAVGARACHVAILINGAVEVDGVALILQVWRGFSAGVGRIAASVV